jgi:exonuclease VII small subunit|tara:strand:- start:68 stop:250 length:183 start_codon:yes stop_codon:yes gene_type:complete
MAVDPQQKLETLNSELQQVVDNFNKANQVVENCKQRIFELKGAIAAVEDILKPDEPAIES